MIEQESTMYVPPHFAQHDPALLLEVMQRYNFATLVSNLDGAPYATHLPVLARCEGDAIVIEGHVARANPHWQALETDPHALLMFHGPHSYISPTLFQPGNRVPTWDYIAVHAGGRVQLQHDAASKLGLLSKLVAHHEPEFQSQLDAMPVSARDGLLKGIVAFRMAVDKLEGKFKLGQHRLADDQPQKQAHHAQGGEDEREIAQWMQRLGYWP
jgi:transcriptional regulator